MFWQQKRKQKILCHNYAAEPARATVSRGKQPPRQHLVLLFWFRKVKNPRQVVAAGSARPRRGESKALDKLSPLRLRAPLHHSANKSSGNILSVCFAFTESKS